MLIKQNLKLRKESMDKLTKWKDDIIKYILSGLNVNKMNSLTKEINNYRVYIRLNLKKKSWVSKLNDEIEIWFHPYVNITCININDSDDYIRRKISLNGTMSDINPNDIFYGLDKEIVNYIMSMVKKYHDRFIEFTDNEIIQDDKLSEILKRYFSDSKSVSLYRYLDSALYLLKQGDKKYFFFRDFTEPIKSSIERFEKNFSEDVKKYIKIKEINNLKNKKIKIKLERLEPTEKEAEMLDCVFNSDFNLKKILSKTIGNCFTSFRLKLSKEEKILSVRKPVITICCSNKFNGDIIVEKKIYLDESIYDIIKRENAFDRLDKEMLDYIIDTFKTYHDKYISYVMMK